MASAGDRSVLQWSRTIDLRHAGAGRVSGWDNPEQVIFAKLMGTGVADEQAKVKGLGMEWWLVLAIGIRYWSRIAFECLSADPWRSLLQIPMIDRHGETILI